MRMETCSLCENIIQDTETKTISLISLIERMNSPVYPLFLHKLCAYCKIIREEHEPSVITVRIRILVNGQPAIEGNIPVNFNSLLNTNLIATFNGLIVATPGNAALEVYYGDILLGGYTFEFAQIGQINTIQPQHQA